MNKLSWNEKHLTAIPINYFWREQNHFFFALFLLFFCSFDTQPTMYTAQIYYSNTMSCCSPSLSLSPLPQNFNLCGQFQLPQLRWNCVSAIRHRLDERYSNLDKNCLSFRSKLSILCKDKQTKSRSPDFVLYRSLVCSPLEKRIKN